MIMDRKQNSKNYSMIVLTLRNKSAFVRKRILSMIAQFLNSNSLTDTSAFRMEGSDLYMVGIQ